MLAPKCNFEYYWTFKTTCSIRLQFHGLKIEGPHLHTIQWNLSWKTAPLAIKVSLGSQHRWTLVTGSITLKFRTFWTFCQKYLVFQDRWSLMAVLFQDRFHCISWLNKGMFNSLFVSSYICGLSICGIGSEFWCIYTCFTRIINMTFIRWCTMIWDPVSG